MLLLNEVTPVLCGAWSLSILILFSHWLFVTPLQLMLPRGSVFACFAGGLVHMLEGWTHHEVGPIDVDKIDVTWEAAMRHGFTPVV